ncbi:MAG: radical SAM protein [Candidatus Scalindua sp.]|jgi:MoaA/NifB/PqqE/SkfB family radical SAM enzyme|nr:radical SAM protein [Candidatus Scalindua sp.]MBT6040665.1 radical SAM protein [Candidatus Woesearchaeota archaeon]MBT6561877.1 radical SAM protein [Candidatus Scalindua sp.]
MKIRRHINNYNFIASQETGMTFRWGETFDDNPLYAPVPELADISISNHCTKKCSFCYRDSNPNNSFISVSDYKYILDSLNHPLYGNVFQVAIGGGEPLEHPDFLELIRLTREYNIVPNFTTNGEHLSDEIADVIKSEIGAVAVSVIDFNNFPNTEIGILIKNGIRTNIHFVLDSNSLSQAVKILQGQYNSKLNGINAIIFLTFKPSGRGDSNFALVHNKEMKQFIELIDANNCLCNIGFDACFVPLLMSQTSTKKNFIDSCEVGCFSVYIDENLNVSPCSFSNGKDVFNLKEFDFYDIWMNKFSDFRSESKNQCKQSCSSIGECKGQCYYYPEITLCYKEV